MSEPVLMNIQKVLEMLPHRYPFLLVDRVVEFTPGESLRAYKNVTINEPFFNGHFPGRPVMPGVLIMEALAQAGGILVVDHLGGLEGKVFFFTGMEKVKFRRPVVPGDRLDLHVDDVKNRRAFWKMNATAYVEGEVAAQGLLTAAVIDEESL